jgi:hypothetical protein
MTGPEMLEELSDMLRREVRPLVVLGSLQRYTNEQRLAIITACQHKMAEIRKQQLIFFDHAIDDFGRKVLLEEDQFMSQITLHISRLPDHRALQDELFRMYALVRIMKTAEIVTEDGEPVDVNRPREDSLLGCECPLI